jgi:hypothetical protein
MKYKDFSENNLHGDPERREISYEVPVSAVFASFLKGFHYQISGFCLNKEVQAMCLRYKLDGRRPAQYLPRYSQTCSCFQEIQDIARSCFVSVKIALSLFIKFSQINFSVQHKKKDKFVKINKTSRAV